MRRPLLLAGLAAAALAVLLAAVVLLRPVPVPAPRVSELAPTARTPEDLARAACVRVRLAGQGVQADAAARVVRAELRAARVLAAEAVRRDGRWAGLSGGVAALDEAVAADDPVAAGLGLQTALAACP